MIRIIDNKDTGKTKRLLKECANNNGLFICKHPERIDEKCDAYGIPRVATMRYDDYEGYVNEGANNIYIDELEEFVTTIYPELAGYTLTKEE